MKNILIIALAVLICGCASSGTNFNSSRVADIKKGQTTKAQLVSMFGQPNQSGVNSDGNTTLTWIYVQSNVNGASFIPIVGAFAGGVNTKTKSLTVNLGADGTVSSYNYSGGEMDARNMAQSDPDSTNVTVLKSPRAATQN